MANHFNDFYEKLDKGNFLYSGSLTNSQIKHAIKFADKTAKQSVCFDAGNIDGLNAFKVIPELVILPFENCWIEFNANVENNENLIFGNLCSNREGVIDSQCWRKDKSGWLYLFCWEEFSKQQSTVMHYPEGLSMGAMQTVISAIRLFLSAINCTNINRVEHIAPEKLQKSRKKKGKLPLFSYWTLEIDPQKSRADGHDYFGTHESPRVHLRKGHPRKCASGKWTWVRACSVGDKTLGMIHKDYKLKQPKPETE